jgi:hypothetical protein
MTRFKPPRYQSSDAARVAELHDAAMDHLVAEYAARTGHSSTPDVPDADPASVTTR